ncbi:MAG: lipopolysaccharide heptosyltransferase I [Gammaproteobacteria bacterium]
MKIAVVKLSALGDIVHAMVALQFIKEYDPAISIDWVVEEIFAPVLHFNPHIDRILPVNLKALKKNKLQFFRELQKVRHFAERRYDLIIDAQGLLKSALTSKLLGQRTAGFARDSIREPAASWLYSETYHCPYHANSIDRNAFILSAPLDFAITPQQIFAKQPFLFFRDADTGIDRYFRNDRKNILFVVGSTWESRNYPREKFLDVAAALQENCLVPWGNAQERAKAEWLAQRSDYIRALPPMDLNTLKAAVARCDLLIGNDTGPSHMAWALNRPSITIFGPTPVSRVYQTGINKVVKSASKVDPYKLNKQDFSIRDIDAGVIVALAQQLLS